MNQLLTLQQKADEYLIADPAALQIMLHLQINACRLNRSLLNSANLCGCATLCCTRQPVDDTTWQDLSDMPSGDNFDTLCPNCRQEICEHLGALLFYAAALANAMQLSLSDICDTEIDKLDLLGYFMLM